MRSTRTHGSRVVPQIAKRAAFRVGARREDDPVNPPLVQGGQDFKLAGRIILGVGQENHHAQPRAFGLDRADDVGEVGIGDRRNGDPDRPGSAVFNERATTFGR